MPIYFTIAFCGTTVSNQSGRMILYQFEYVVEVLISMLQMLGIVGMWNSCPPSLLISPTAAFAVRGEFFCFLGGDSLNLPVNDYPMIGFELLKRPVPALVIPRCPTFRAFCFWVEL